ncbi:RICIN domain-containing protein [Flavobacterium sp. YJ01]|nr:RICIN domain-containing protein [Flavobacterium sp. YJ01]WET02965.1 RICIN domain-containing protein [Flavobacterium sp. YJ01]
MKKTPVLILLLILSLLLSVEKGFSQINPYKAPLYWNPYEYNLTKNDYIPEDEWKKNIDWMNENLKSYGYNMICIDGWGDDSNYNQDGYRTTHSSNWIHDYKYWADYLKARGMTLGMYNNPLWINKKAADAGVKIKGTNIPLSTLLNPIEGQEKIFNWVQVNNPGAEQYIKGYVQYYADMGVSYLRIDFLAWFQTGADKGDSTYGPARSTQDYEKALRWIREACDENKIFLSLVMPELQDNAVSENKYGHMIRINEDLGDGGWNRFNNLDRGIRHSWWSQYYNTFDGYTYWSFISGRKKLILDGDFIRLNSMANDNEKKTVISLPLMAGGPLSIVDQYNSIGQDISYYQNEEMLALNKDGFVGKPLFTNDPTNESSQVWAGQMSNGDWIIGFFNRENVAKNRSLDFNSSLGFSGNASVRDLWTHTNLGSMSSYSVNVPAHGCVILKVVPINPQPDILSGNNYFIKSKANGKTIAYNTLRDSLTTNTLDWDKSDQKWLFTFEKNKEYSITSLSDKKSFDVVEQSVNNGAKIHTWQYLGLNSQKWDMVPDGNGYYKIINSNSTKALEMDAARGIVVQSSSTGDSSQLWTLEPIFDHLTLVGPASPTGNWTKPEGTGATDFKESAFGSDVWTFTGYLNLGEIKIHAKAGGFASGSWTSGSWLQAKNSNANFLTANEYVVGGADNKWNVAAAGLYNIKVNLREKSLDVKKIDYDYMTLVGPGSSIGNWATPEGDSSTDFAETAPNSNIWLFKGNLNAGEIKIHVKLGSDFIAGNWLDGSWLQAKSANADFLTQTEYLIDDSNDFKWNIEESGYYIVTVDLNANKIAVQRRYFDYMTLSGPGSPIGSWNKPEGDINTDFIQTCPNSNIWTFTGMLKVGQVKIHAKIGSDFIADNWLDGSWLQAKSNNADFRTAAEYIIDSSNDYKWNVAQAGLYKITVDLTKGLLSVKRLDYDHLTLVGPGSP